MKGGFIESSVYLTCLIFLLNTYAFFATVSEFLHHVILFLLTACGIFGLIMRFRLPKPKEEEVCKILGKDWGAQKGLYTSDNNKIEKDYVMKVIAHRCCGLDAPENSLSAVELVHKEGITAVEFDVMMTRDNVPIVYHDDNLFRLTNLNKEVNETTIDEILKLDLSTNHPFGMNFRGEKIPTLNEFVTCCINRNLRMFIDLKAQDKQICPVINDLFKQYPKLYDLAVVTSFNPVIIYKIRVKDPKIVCCLSWRPFFYSHGEYNDETGPTSPRTNNIFYLFYLRILNHIHQWVLWRFGYYILGLSALLLHKDMITREMIHYWNKREIRIFAWTVNLPTEKQYFEKILKIAYLTDTAINS